MNKKLFIFGLIAVVLSGIFMMSSIANAAGGSGRVAKIKIKSSAFKNNKPIPLKYAHTEAGGENVSPPLEWKVPRKTAKKIKAFAITMVDHHEIANNWMHLAILNIPGDYRNVEEGGFSNLNETPRPWIELYNSFLTQKYGGPNPPPGSGKHTYEITVYGLKSEILLDTMDPNGISENTFLKMIQGKIIAKGKFKGTFETVSVLPSPNPEPPAPPPPPAATNPVIEITSSGFTPSSLTVKKGATVDFVNKDTGVHWPASNVHPTHTSYPGTGGCIGSSFDTCKALARDEVFSFTFDQVGTWNYHDHLSSSRTGSVTVEE